MYGVTNNGNRQQAVAVFRGPTILGLKLSRFVNGGSEHVVLSSVLRGCGEGTTARPTDQITEHGIPELDTYRMKT